MHCSQEGISKLSLWSFSTFWRRRPSSFLFAVQGLKSPCHQPHSLDQHRVNADKSSLPAPPQFSSLPELFFPLLTNSFFLQELVSGAMGCTEVSKHILTSFLALFISVDAITIEWSKIIFIEVKTWWHIMWVFFFFSFHKFWLFYGGNFFIKMVSQVSGEISKIIEELS